MKQPLFIVLSWLPYSGMAIFPFVFVKQSESQNDKTLVYHERIHLLQQLELLLVFFLVLYFLNYLCNLVRYRNHHKAYREICFEREAYQNENVHHYIRNRRQFAFLNYL